MSYRTLLLTLLVGCLMMPVVAMAQAQGGQGGQGGRQRGGNRNFDPAQMRQRMMEMMKERLGASDEEWKVIEPKLEKVTTAQRETRGGFGGRGGRGFRGNNNGDNANLSKVAQAQQDLRTLLENQNATADQISAKLTALRDARKQAQDDLVAAQKDLKSVLTQRQEAVLVMMGMLE